MLAINHLLLSTGRRRVTAGILAVAFGAAAGVAHAQGVRLVVVDVKAVGQGYQLSKLTGKNVHNDKDEKIGTLDDFIITKDRSLIAILQVGGFLGLGGRLIAIPYESLNIGDDGRKIVLAGASKEALGKLPEFTYAK
jgi:sporulation protein YlmC with PRC-barrel domain